jgi:type III restriction enzyme
VYEPDFIVRLLNGTNLVLEVKGYDLEHSDPKHQGRRRWIEAVNNWGKLGRWDFLVCHDPQRLCEEIGRILA